jgi:hypothetical protein
MLATELTRREILSLALASPLLTAVKRITVQVEASILDIRSLVNLSVLLRRLRPR